MTLEEYDEKRLDLFGGEATQEEWADFTSDLITEIQRLTWHLDDVRDQRNELAEHLLGRGE